MVGRELTEMYPKRPAAPGEPVLELHDWSVRNPNAHRGDLVRDVDLVVRAGEVVGIFGLLGSGAFDLARSLFGSAAGHTSGTLRVGGKEVRLAGPGDAIRHGIAYLPAERKRDGLITSHTIATNMSLVALPRLSRAGLIDRRIELQSIQRYIADLHVKCDSIEQPIEQLSGGNQQKVVAAKWLMTEPDIFVLEEPTRGVDVNARIDFYQLINDLSAAGKAVVLVSTDLPEILGMADRVIAMHEGRLVRAWPRGEASEEAVMLHAAGEQEAVA
jgi:ABC-type sugar transport system ATPase subunit